MKNNWSKLLTLVLALIMVLSCFAFVACGNDDPQDPGTQDPGTQDPGTQDPGTQDPGAQDPGEDDDNGDYLLRIPKQQYNKTYTFLTREADEHANEVYIESEDAAMASTVDTAIFYRNNRVAEHLGVTFDLITDPNGGWSNRSGFISHVQQSFNAGDQDFQLMSIYMAYAAELAVLGLAADANSLESVDFSAPWYVQSWHDNMTVFDRNYMVLSDLSYTMWNRINAMYFNKQLSDELGISDALYELAEDGELTLDYVMS